MRKRATRLGLFLLCAGCLIGVPHATRAGSTVTVTFSGKGTSPPNTTFNGSFDYSTSLTDPGYGGNFDFTNSQYAHGASYYTYTSGPTLSSTDSYVANNVFKINTVQKSFTLVTVLTSNTLSPATQMVVNITCLTTLNPHALPVCSAFPTSGTIGNFTLYQNDVQIFTGPISTLSCNAVNYLKRRDRDDAAGEPDSSTKCTSAPRDARRELGWVSRSGNPAPARLKRRLRTHSAAAFQRVHAAPGRSALAERPKGKTHFASARRESKQRG